MPEIRAAPGLPRISHLLGYVLAVLLAGGLVNCGGGGRSYRGGGYAGSGNYSPPGGRDDPWGPYIRQAANRFGVPQRWIREVMRQESGGHQYLNGRLTTSSSGAMGLMQIMPATYAELRQRYGLGADAYDPHDNIMAGAAYIREMYDRFGYPEFLAAYNAGPGRVSDYLAGDGKLPSETVNYVASIAPRIAGTPAPSGPSPAETEEQRIVVAERTPAPPPAPPPAASVLRVAMVAPSPSACDPDAAYDPAAPCAPVVQAPAAIEAAAPVTMAPIYDPEDRPAPATATEPPVPTRLPPRRAAPVPLPPLPPRPRVQLAAVSAAETPFAHGGRWSVQVGAFSTPAQARAIAAAARFAVPDLLGRARIEIPTKQMVGAVLYRARLSGISSAAAARTCARLGERGMACLPVGPGQVW